MTIPIVIVLGAALALAEYGGLTLPIVAVVAYELVVALHENGAELGLHRIARRLPARIRNARS